MRTKGLVTRAMRSCRPLRGLYLLPIITALEAQPAPAELAEVNEALRSWLQVMNEDRAYLLFDRNKGHLDLRHGGAILRRCQVVTDFVDASTLGSGQLLGQIRRYRPSHPWAIPSSGPFDWEQVLADEAGDDAALLFSNQLLIIASDAWDRPRGPAVRVGSRDLRTLCNTLDNGTSLVILPPGWRDADEP